MKNDLISRREAIEMCREPRMRNADCSDFEMEIMMLPSAQPKSASELAEKVQNAPNDDFISRKAAIEAFDNLEWFHQNANKDMVSGANPEHHQAWYKEQDIYKALEQLPSAQPEHTNSWYINSWCNNCKEYDKAKHSCPRFNRVIKQTIDEIYSHAEIVRCKDCKYWMPHSQLGFDEDNGTYHDYCAKLVPEDEYYAFYRNADDYCSRAERRTDESG